MARHPGRCWLKAVPAFIPRSEQARRTALALHTAQPEGCLPGILLSELQAQSRATPVLWLLSLVSQ